MKYKSADVIKLIDVFYNLSKKRRGWVAGGY